MSALTALSIHLTNLLNLIRCPVTSGRVVIFASFERANSDVEARSHFLRDVEQSVHYNKLERFPLMRHLSRVAALTRASLRVGKASGLNCIQIGRRAVMDPAVTRSRHVGVVGRFCMIQRLITARPARPRDGLWYEMCSVCLLNLLAILWRGIYA